MKKEYTFISKERRERKRGRTFERKTVYLGTKKSSKEDWYMGVWEIGVADVFAYTYLPTYIIKRVQETFDVNEQRSFTTEQGDMFWTLFMLRIFLTLHFFNWQLWREVYSSNATSPKDISYIKVS